VHFKAISGDLTLVAKARRTSGRDLRSTSVIDRPGFPRRRTGDDKGRHFGLTAEKGGTQ
jgi:hypothetical protein